MRSLGAQGRGDCRPHSALSRPLTQGAGNEDSSTWVAGASGWTWLTRQEHRSGVHLWVPLWVLDLILSHPLQGDKNSHLGRGEDAVKVK